MYEVGEYIVHPEQGVCKVENVIKPFNIYAVQLTECPEFKYKRNNRMFVIKLLRSEERR